LVSMMVIGKTFNPTVDLRKYYCSKVIEWCKRYTRCHLNLILYIHT